MDIVQVCFLRDYYLMAAMGGLHLLEINQDHIRTSDKYRCFVGKIGCNMLQVDKQGIWSIV